MQDDPFPGSFYEFSWLPRSKYYDTGKEREYHLGLCQDLVFGVLRKKTVNHAKFNARRTFFLVLDIFSCYLEPY